MTLKFHSTHTAERAKHSQGHVLHAKHTLTDSDHPDRVICMIVRRDLHRSVTVEELPVIVEGDAGRAEPMLRQFAEDTSVFRPPF